MKRGELEVEISERIKLVEQLNRQLEEQEKNYGVLSLKGTEQVGLIESLRSQLAEEISLREKVTASSATKTWAIVLLGVLLTIASAISAQSYL